jgi:hypothetical protein
MQWRPQHSYKLADGLGLFLLVPPSARACDVSIILPSKAGGEAGFRVRTENAFEAIAREYAENLTKVVKAPCHRLRL